jgi:hypothetical protein
MIEHITLDALMSAYPGEWWMDGESDRVWHTRACDGVTRAEWIVELSAMQDTLDLLIDAVEEIRRLRATLSAIAIPSPH